MSNRRLEDVSLTCILNHYILKTSSEVFALNTVYIIEKYLHKTIVD